MRARLSCAARRCGSTRAQPFAQRTTFKGIDVSLRLRPAAAVRARPEQAHELTLKSLEAGIYPRPPSPDDGRLAVGVWGLTFPNPLGIAAGFDKDARVPDAVLGMGFGFRDRHGHTAAAAGQSAPTRVPPDRGSAR